MAAQLTTNATKQSGFWTEDSDTILITRTTLSGYPPTPTVTTVYNGAGDFQNAPQGIQFNPSGEVEYATAEIIIDPDSTGTLPTVNTGDTVTVNGTVYGIVVDATVWTAQPKHLAILAKHGPIPYGPA